MGLALVASGCPSSPKGDPERPLPGGELRVAVRDLSSLDPAKATGRGALLAVSQIFDSLTAVDPKTNKVVPAVAKSWSVGKDGKTWTFRLGGSRFHDRRRVTAADFKFAFDRIARRKTASDYAFQLEQVRGFRDAKIAGKAKGLSGVVAVGKTKLIVKLDRPYAELPVSLAHPALAPLEVRRYGKRPKGLAKAPIGNGPFKVARASPGGQATLARFESYPGSAAFLDRLKIQVVPTQQDGWRRFLDDLVHVAEVPSAAIEAERGRFARTGFTPFWAAVYYGFNLRLDKYAKPEVRRAISLAIDRQAIARTVYGGTKDPATGIIPRGVRGYSPDSCGACSLERGRAKRILKAAFGKKGLSLTIDHLKAQPNRRVARAIAADLKSVGVTVTLRQHTPRKYLRLLKDKKQDFSELGWFADVPTPDPFLAQQLRTESPNNPMRFTDKTFDRALDKARAAKTERRRLAHYRAAESRALSLMPIVPIVFFRNHLAVGDLVRGVVVDGAGLFDAATVWLARG